MGGKEGRKILGSVTFNVINITITLFPFQYKAQLDGVPPNNFPTLYIITSWVKWEGEYQFGNLPPVLGGEGRGEER